MSGVGPSTTGLSALLLPGQLPTNAEQAGVVDTWSLTYAAESSAVAQVVNSAGDTWSLLLTLEGSILDGFSLNVDTWSLTFTEQPLNIQVTAPPVTDTWSAQFNEQPTLITGNLQPVASVDTWSMSWGDISLLTISDYWTELGMGWLLPRANRDGFTDKTVPANAQLGTVDTYSLTWTESPTDTVQLDLWDIYSLTFSPELSGVVVSQSFPALDTWAVSFQEVSSVTASGVLPFASVDTWSLTYSAEISQISNGIIPVVDTWSISAADVSAVAVTSDQKNTSDAWTLQWVLDSGSTTVVGNVPVNASDEWDTVFVDSSALLIAGSFSKAASDTWSLSFIDQGFLNDVVIQVSARRRIEVSGTIRNVKVE